MSETPNPNVFTYLDVSTAHLTEQTCNAWLDENTRSSTSGVISYGKGDYGSFVHVSEDLDELRVAREYEPDESEFDAVPQDLLDVLRSARGLGCRWVQFDMDGDTSAVLPQFEWRTPRAGDIVYMRVLEDERKVTPGMVGLVIADPDGDTAPGSTSVIWSGPISPFTWAVATDHLGVLAQDKD